MAMHLTESGTPVHCLTAADLLASKQATGRDKDTEDIEFLKIKLATKT